MASDPESRQGRRRQRSPTSEVTPVRDRRQGHHRQDRRRGGQGSPPSGSAVRMGRGRQGTPVRVAAVRVSPGRVGRVRVTAVRGGPPSGWAAEVGRWAVRVGHRQGRDRQDRPPSGSMSRQGRRRQGRGGPGMPVRVTEDLAVRSPPSGSAPPYRYPATDTRAAVARHVKSSAYRPSSDPEPSGSPPSGSGSPPSGSPPSGSPPSGSPPSGSRRQGPRRQGRQPSGSPPSGCR